MGSLVLPVRQLLSQPQLVLDEWMPLDGALPDSKILLRAELKVTVNSYCNVIHCNSLQLKQQAVNVYRS